MEEGVGQAEFRCLLSSTLKQEVLAAVQSDQIRQDEAMSVTTEPDTAAAVKPEEMESEQPGANGFQSQDPGGGPHVPSTPRGIVVLTPAQAKEAKLQKGYTLEPILVEAAAGAPPALVSGKRERRTSKHFGNCGCGYK
jgi:hypothetical protein